jgi:hypothetical protein
MENNFASGEPNPRRAAAELLDDLQADQERLAERAEAPRWLAPGFGLIAALYVAAPALPGEPRSNGIVTTCIIIGVVLVYLSSRATGIKFSRFGLRAWLAFAGALVGTLVLFSFSLGLVSLDSHWWVAATAAAAFALVFWLTRLIFSSMREALNRGQ